MFSKSGRKLICADAQVCLKSKMTTLKVAPRGLEEVEIILQTLHFFLIDVRENTYSHFSKRF